MAFTLTLSDARRVIKFATTLACERQLVIGVAVADAESRLLSLERMEGAPHDAVKLAWESAKRAAVTGDTGASALCVYAADNYIGTVGSSGVGHQDIEREILELAVARAFPIGWPTTP